MYAIIGVHLFGDHSKEHFGSLSQAFLTLFQTITLDDWKNLLASASTGSPAIAVIYFVSFILLGTMIMLNLFIGIIMNSMSEMHDELDEQIRAKQDIAAKGDIWNDLTALDEQLSVLKSHIKDLRGKLANIPCAQTVYSLSTRNLRKPWLAVEIGEVERTVMVSTGLPTRLTSALVAVTGRLEVAV
jgi:Ion transport protein